MLTDAQLGALEDVYEEILGLLDAQLRRERGAQMVVMLAMMAVPVVGRLLTGPSGVVYGGGKLDTIESTGTAGVQSGSAAAGNVGQGTGKSIPTKNINELPEHVQNSFYKYDQAGWKGNIPGQTAGTRAGGIYYNLEGRLPKVDAKGNPIVYREWDVNNRQPGFGRDGERFVTGSDGSIYYSDSHYGEAVSPSGLPPFVKIR